MNDFGQLVDIIILIFGVETVFIGNPVDTRAVAMDEVCGGVRVGDLGKPAQGVILVCCGM